VKKDPFDREDNPSFYFWVSLFNQIYWVSGSLIGVLIGHLLPINTTGIDFSLTALFVTVAVDQWVEAKKHWPAIAGGICSIACRLIFGPDSFLIPTMFAIIIALSAPDIIGRIHRRADSKNREERAPENREGQHE